MTDIDIEPGAGVAGAGASTPVAVGDYLLHIEGYLDLEARSPAQIGELFSRMVPNLAALPTSIRAFDGTYGLVFAARDGSCTYLVADTLGTWPIYYSETPTGWAWSFRLSKLMDATKDRSVDLDAVGEMLQQRWLMTERTLVAGIKQVLPSHYVCLRPGQRPQVVRYKDMHFRPADNGRSHDEVVEQADAALDAYFARLRRRHSRIGVFFSGGVDSSVIVAKARAHGFERLVAVTASFEGHANPEAQRAEEIARHLGVEFRRVEVSNERVASSLPDLLSALERPPTYMNSFARSRLFESVAQDVEIVLTGDATDVDFGNSMMLNVHRYAGKQRYVRQLPTIARRGLSILSNAADTRILRQLRFHLDHSTEDFVREMGSVESAPANDRLSSRELVPALAGRRAADRPLYWHCEVDGGSPLAFYQTRALYTGTRNHYVHYNLLGAPYGISVGCPFECLEIFKLALDLPDRLKFDQLGPKAIVKRLATRFVPRELVYAKKMAFVAPSAQWLSGPLAGWCSMLSEERTISRGIFDKGALARLEPERDYLNLWMAITIELFCRMFIDGQRFVGDK